MIVNIENYLRRNLQEDSDLDFTDEIIEYLVELEKKHDTQEQMVKELSDLVCQTEQRLKEAEEVIEFYGDEDSYSWYRENSPDYTGEGEYTTTKIVEDGGLFAQEYLNKYKEDV